MTIKDSRWHGMHYERWDGTVLNSGQKLIGGRIGPNIDDMIEEGKDGIGQSVTTEVRCLAIKEQNGVDGKSGG